MVFGLGHRTSSLERAQSTERIQKGGGVLSKRSSEFSEYSLAYAPPGLMKQLKPSQSKDNLTSHLSALTHHGKPLKISRRSQFSHIVPRKQSQSPLRGAWLIWVVVAVLVTATVLLPPRVKLIMFDGHRYNRADAKGADGKAAEVALTLAPLLHKYPQQHSWLVLGLDAHVCKVLLTMQAEVGPSVIGAAPRAVQCDGAKLLPLRANLGGGGVDSRLAGISNNTTVLGGGDDADADGSSGAAAGDGGGGGGGGGLDSGRYDAVVVVGSELTRAAVSPTTSEGKRAVRDAGVMIREAVRMTRKDVWVLEPDGVAKDRRQPLTELNLQGCRRDKDNAANKEARRELAGFNTKLFSCSLGGVTAAQVGAAAGAGGGSTTRRPLWVQRPYSYKTAL